MKLIVISQMNKKAAWKDLFNFFKSPKKKDELTREYINPAIKDINDSISDLIVALVEVEKQKGYQTGMWADPNHQNFWNDWETAFNYIKNVLTDTREILRSANRKSILKTSAYEVVDDNMVWESNKRKIDLITNEILRNTVQEIYDASYKLKQAFKEATKSKKELPDKWFIDLHKSIKKLWDVYHYLADISEHPVPSTQ